jgi:hypothetical protein
VFCVKKHLKKDLAKFWRAAPRPLLLPPPHLLLPPPPLRLLLRTLPLPLPPPLLLPLAPLLVCQPFLP